MHFSIRSAEHAIRAVPAIRRSLQQLGLLDYADGKTVVVLTGNCYARCSPEHKP